MTIEELYEAIDASLTPEQRAELEAQIAKLEETVNAWKQVVDRLKIEIAGMRLAHNNLLIEIETLKRGRE